MVWVLVEKRNKLNQVSDGENIDAFDVLGNYHFFVGAKAIYLEAGSGAIDPIAPKIIQRIKRATGLPLIVGGGLRKQSHIKAAWAAGADMVVVGTAIEEILFKSE